MKNMEGTEEEKIDKEKIKHVKEPKPVHVEIDPPAQDKQKTKRKTRRRITKKATKELESNLSMMVTTIFSMMEARNPIWHVEPSEIEAIVGPGARILQKMEADNQANEYADYIMLLVGVGGIVFPRLLMSRMMQNDKPKNESAKSDTGNSRSNASHGGGSVKGILPGLA